MRCLTFWVLLCGLVLFAASSKEALASSNNDGPSEYECRPYIEKALNELKTDDSTTNKDNILDYSSITEESLRKRREAQNNNDDDSEIKSDKDGDGVPDEHDSDIDGDGIPNAIDTDKDGDGLLDESDNNERDGETETETSKEERADDADVSDRDGDGIPDHKDDDIDGDGILNADDADKDGDGVLDGFEQNDINGDDDDDDDEPKRKERDDIEDEPDPENALESKEIINDETETETDRDGDGIPDHKDDDIDGDGILNADDSDKDGDGILDANVINDIDGDGVEDDGHEEAHRKEQEEEETTSKEPDRDGDGIPDRKDDDIDGDGILNVHDADKDGDGKLDENNAGDNAGDNELQAQRKEDDDNEEKRDADAGSDKDKDKDKDGDGIPDHKDDDIDGDGIPNTIDSDKDGDGIEDKKKNDSVEAENEGEGDAEAEDTGSGVGGPTADIVYDIKPEDELLWEGEIPQNRRNREHITEILQLDESFDGREKAVDNIAAQILRDIKRIYENAIQPLESLYKYRDLSNRHFGDPEIFSKPLILFMGPWSGGKSSILNYLADNEYTPYSLVTGAEPSPAYFNILMWGNRTEVLDGTQLAADYTFAGLQKFGQGLEERLRGLKLNRKLLEKVNIVEIPGILEVRKQVSRVFPFNDACQWFIDRADIIFLVYDPAKLDVGPETEAILDQLKGREYQTRIILNKADTVKPEELLRVQSALIWNISPLMSSAQPPLLYTTSLWSNPYQEGAPARLLHAQERAFLRDLRTAIDKRIEHKISSARRFAVRVRNHAKMVDCYLNTYYNHKSIFGNRKRITDDIINNPQNYHIYEGLSTLTNISRYDLPDPEVYRDFFRLNPLYEFKKLTETCTYFRGCPISKLDVAIAYDLPELAGKYKKLADEALTKVLAKENNNNNGAS